MREVHYTLHTIHTEIECHISSVARSTDKSVFYGYLSLFRNTEGYPLYLHFHGILQ